MLDDVQMLLAVAAFAITAAVFAVGVWKALRLRPEKKDHLASLPLDDGDSK